MMPAPEIQGPNITSVVRLTMNNGQYLERARVPEADS
jgi:hypothetical protein